MHKPQCPYFIQYLLTLALISCCAAVAAKETTSLDSVIAGNHRDAGNVARDKYRHPKETLQFFGIRPDMKVLEVLPGAGWYTEILAPYLRDHGQLISANRSPEGLNDYFRNSIEKYNAKLDADPASYGKVVHAIYIKDGKILADVKDNSLDMVFNARNTHNMIRFGGLEDAYAAFYRVLKPGGILAVLQHRAPADSNAVHTAKTGYVPEDFLIKFCEGLGFRFVANSEINANPKDTRDYPKGVWTLPPSYRLGDEDREKYSAIGESDRMTLKFIKPSN